MSKKTNNKTTTPTVSTTVRLPNYMASYMRLFTAAYKLRHPGTLQQDMVAAAFEMMFSLTDDQIAGLIEKSRDSQNYEKSRLFQSKADEKEFTNALFSGKFKL